jgi:hypothetical protein
MNDAGYQTELRRELQNRRVWKRSKSLSDLWFLKSVPPKKPFSLSNDGGGDGDDETKSHS